MNRDLQHAARNLRRKGPFLRGLLGDFDSHITVSGRPGYYYVRVEKPGGYEVGIFPGRVRPLYNLPVQIETHPLTGIQYIAGLDDVTVAYGGTDPATIPGDVGLHGETHSWGGDDMPVWLHSLQIFPLRCQPHATNNKAVLVQSGTYFAEGVFAFLAAPVTVDLTAYVPSFGVKYILLYLDAAGEVGVIDNGATNLSGLGVAPTGMYTLAAVRLIPTGITWQDIVDLRFMPQNPGLLMAFLDLLDTPSAYTDAAGDKLVVKADTSGIEFQDDTFLTLDDTPADYTDDGGKRVFVKVDQTGLEFLPETFLTLDDTPADYTDDAGKKVVVNPTADGLDFKADTFLTLDDTPADYTDDGGKRVFVKVDQTGLEFLPETFLTLDDTPGDYTGDAGKKVIVSFAEDGLDFEADTFITLNDTPSAYTGQGAKIVAVKADETGLEFVTGGGGGGGGDTAITFQARYWTVDGPLAVASEVGGVWRIVENFIINYCSMYLYDTGDSSSTIIDFDVSNDGGATWTTLFTTVGNRPTLVGGATDKRATSVPDITLLYAGDLVRLNIEQVAVGARDLSAQIDGEVHQMSPTLYAVTLTSADTEYSQALPAGLRALSFKARGSVAIRWAFVTGKVATPTDPYETLEAGQTYFKENLVGAAVTLYLASSTAGTVVEVEVWA
ncbi:MAG TPA: hypothetical protein PKZ84_10100 [Anaerolineae bacterium]|nr:hypothetical protein [Anaerolineae bacterium]HQI85014.1 hypothetical protein [Anaerolineae bacterium]